MKAVEINHFYKAFSSEVFDHSWRFHSISLQIIPNAEFIVNISLWADREINQMTILEEFEDFTESFLGEYREYDVLLVGTDVETEGLITVGKLHFK